MENVEFETEIIVKIGDINYGGHVGNDRFLLYFHDARLRFLDTIECSELDIGNGIGLIMTEAYVSYISQARYGDVLNIKVNISEIKKVRFKMNYVINNKITGHKVAEGYTVLSSYDYRNNKIARLTDKLLKGIN